MSPREQICGIHAVRHALPSGRGELWLDAQRSDLEELRALADAHDIPVYNVSARRISHVLSGELHQGALLIRDAGRPPELSELRIQPDTLLLALDGVQDPHNLGACMRALDAAGGQGLIAPRHRAAALTPTARKAASGAAERIPLYRHNLAQAVQHIQQQGVHIVGMAHDAPESLYSVDFRLPTLLVLGGEGRGLRTLTRRYCDTLVSIPQHGSVTSLNVSVAAAIALFEAARQRA